MGKGVNIRRGMLWAQLAISVVVAVLGFGMCIGYRITLARLPAAVAESMLATSRAVEQIAATVIARQDLLKQVAGTIASTRELVEAIELSAQTQKALLPRYATDLRNSASLIADVGITMHEIGDGLDFMTPAGIRWQGVRTPSVEWARPLHGPAMKLKDHGDHVRELGATVLELSKAIAVEAPDTDARLIELCKQTIAFLKSAEGAAVSLESSELPAALESLHQTSATLTQSAGQVRLVDWFITGVLVLWTLAGIALSLNAWAVLFGVKT